MMPIKTLKNWNDCITFCYKKNLEISFQNGSEHETTPLRISRIIGTFSFCSLQWALYSGTKTDTEEKYLTKIEKQRQRLRCAEQSRLCWKWRLENRHWIGFPKKQKHSLHFVMDPQNPAHATKIEYNVQNVSCGLT